MDYHRAFELLQFIAICNSNDYSIETNLAYLRLGEKYNAASSLDVINNEEYAEEIAFLKDKGVLTTPEAAPGPAHPPR